MKRSYQARSPKGNVRSNPWSCTVLLPGVSLFISDLHTRAELMARRIRLDLTLHAVVGGASEKNVFKKTQLKSGVRQPGGSSVCL